jgi:hypothetical protein
MAVIETKVYRFVGFVLDRFNLTDSAARVSGISSVLVEGATFEEAFCQAAECLTEDLLKDSDMHHEDTICIRWDKSYTGGPL